MKRMVRCKCLINENFTIPLGISEEFRKRRLNVDYIEEMLSASKKPKINLYILTTTQTQMKK